MPRECRTFAAVILLCCCAAVYAIELLPAYAQTTDQLTVYVESDRYSFGDTVVITGRLEAAAIDQPLLIQVIDPQGSRVRTDQISVAADGEYRYSFVAGGLMKTVGVYKAEVSYKGFTHAEASFVLGFPERPSGILRVVIDGQDHSIRYLVTGNGNKLLNITADSSRNSSLPGDARLIVSLSTQSDGTLSLGFQKEFFDANERFIAFAGGKETEVVDESYGDTNVISIDFQAGTEEILIVGDHIIPEFGGSLVPLLLASAIGLSTMHGRFRSRLPEGEEVAG